MSWVERLLPHIQAKIKHEDAPRHDSTVPEGVWTKCPDCGQALFSEEVARELYVCPQCGCHMRMKARERIERFLDEKGQVEIASEVVSVDPLTFVDSKPYPKRLRESEAKAQESEALIIYQGTLLGRKVVVAAFDFTFMGGSMGSAVGERFVRAIEVAVREKRPYIVFTASGGARMQEGLFSLMQMAKTSAALERLNAAKLPFIPVLTDPTMGGVSASFAFLGDVVIAEPKALIGFAGPRVIEQTVRQSLPEGFQRSEMLLKKGAIDMIVDRRELRQTVATLISHLTSRGA